MSSDVNEVVQGLAKQTASNDVAVQSALKTSPELDKYAGAMCKVQQDIENPERNRDVTVTGRSREGKAYSYTFKYATYDKILEQARPLLSKAGICILQVPTTTEEGLAVITRLLHTSGQWVESTY
ncbi:MAG: ERF family protein, partial [Pseudomonadales bacterium]